jgi:hypothetical protein
VTPEHEKAMRIVMAGAEKAGLKVERESDAAVGVVVGEVDREKICLLLECIHHEIVAAMKRGDL